MGNTEHIVHADDSTFESIVLKTNDPALVDFWAPWCGPCLTIGPVLEEIAKDYAGRITVVKVNVDESPNTARKYGVRSIPSLLFIQEGKVKDSRVGSMPKAQLKAFIDSNMG